MADLTIDERFAAKKNRMNNSSYNNAVAIVAATQNPATYGKWVQVVYEDSLQSVINKFDDGLPQPFKNIIVNGDSNTFTDYGSLKLDDSDTWGWDSGSFHAKLKDNWMVKFNVWSDNFEYFEENLKAGRSERFDDDSFSGNGDGYTDWINFYLIDEDDYISIDIDGIDANVAQLKLVIEGVNYIVSNPDESDANAKIWLKEVWQWNPTYATIAYVPQGGGDDDPIVCPEGYTLNEATQQCEVILPECDEGYTYNPVTEQCEIDEYEPPNNQCGDGFTWDMDLQMCVPDGGGGGGFEYTGEDFSIALIIGAMALILYGAFSVVTK